MAEGILKKLLKTNKIDHIVVGSAGTMAPIGMPPTNYAILTTVERGVDISSHRAKLLTAEMTHEADLILVMEEAHRRFVENLLPSAKNKTSLLTSFPRNKSGKDIDDPIGGDLDTYRKCYQIIENEINRILPDIVQMIHDE